MALDAFICYFRCAKRGVPYGVTSTFTFCQDDERDYEDVRIIAVAGLGVVMLYLAIFLPNALAVTTSSASDVTISTDRSNYTGNATIVVSGTVPEAKDFDVTVTITSPGGAVIATSGQRTDEDSGGFTVSFKAGGPSWGDAGNYTATVIFPGQIFISGTITFAYGPLPTGSSQTTSIAPATSLSSLLPLAALGVAGVLILVVGFLALRMRSKRNHLSQATSAVWMGT
jgi:hypothetical protein